MSLKKAEVLMRGLKEKLQFRMPSTYIFTDSFDSSGNPVLTIAQDSSWNTGDQWAVLRLKPVDNPNVNVLGQAQESFTPHQAQMVAEESLTSGKSNLSDANRDEIMREMVILGTIVETYLRANGTEPVVGDFIAGNLDSKLDDLIHPLTKAV